MVALLSLAISSFYQIPCHLIQMQLNVRGLLASFSKFGLGVLSQLLLSNFIKKFWNYILLLWLYICLGLTDEIKNISFFCVHLYSIAKDTLTVVGSSSWV